MKIPERTWFLMFMALVAFGVLLIRNATWKTDTEIELDEEGREYDLARLNKLPAVPTPPVLVLQGNASGNPFEIIMRGRDYYFAKETWGAARGELTLFGSQRPGGFRVQMCIKDFQGSQALRWWKFNGGRGGGGLAYGATNWMAPGRELWNEHGFVGAQCEGQFRKEWYATESFAALTKKDGTTIPRIIRWKGSSDGETPRIYKVKKFWFTNEPPEAWFVARLNEYFPGHQSLTNSPPTTQVVRHER